MNLKRISLIFARSFSWKKAIRDVLLLSAVLIGVSYYLHSDMASGEAPILSGITTQGKTIALPNKPKEPTLVYFWGTWCGYCSFTSPMVESVAKNHPVISIAIASGTNSEINQHMQNKELEFPVINDSTSRISNRWGVSGVPAIFIIDSQGNIAAKTTGPTSEWGLRLRLWWAGL
ncbi:protein disulfide oxidoreductase [Parashewanella tropica]|uniref:protein disulfide oxidoreductase n=1 Tax=Parashewanella tropica TaxID=2547970 RepID=UPI00105965AD|nr:protein disulfide oxidoreductase [Parashewanella tropica]